AHATQALCPGGFYRHEPRFAQSEAGREVKATTAPGRTFEPDLATHHARQAAADRQPEPRAAIATAGRGVGLREGLEQPLLLFGRDADAGVAYLEAQQRGRGVALDLLDLDDDLASLGELHRVVAQVQQHLPEP